MGVKVHSIGRNNGVILFTGQSLILMGVQRLKICSDTVGQLLIQAPFRGLVELVRNFFYLVIYNIK